MRSHDVDKCIDWLVIVLRSVRDRQELLCKSSCLRYGGRMSPANRRTADPSVIAAIHHPLRRRLIDLLGVNGPSTASRLAEATGELVGNISHHLKVLAAAGVIEEAPELAKTRRERWWRSARASYSWSIADAGGDPAGELVAETAEEANLTHHTTKVRQWFGLRSEYDEPWVRAAMATESWLTLTPERLEEFGARLGALIQEYADEPSEGEDAHPVFVFAHAVPARP
jgi:DNA-binding transcriptional ArsR family regulator